MKSAPERFVHVRRGVTLALLCFIVWWLLSREHEQRASHIMEMNHVTTKMLNAATKMEEARDETLKAMETSRHETEVNPSP